MQQQQCHRAVTVTKRHVGDGIEECSMEYSSRVELCQSQKATSVDESAKGELRTLEILALDLIDMVKDSLRQRRIDTTTDSVDTEYNRESIFQLLDELKCRKPLAEKHQEHVQKIIDKITSLQTALHQRTESLKQAQTDADTYHHFDNALSEQQRLMLDEWRLAADLRTLKTIQCRLKQPCEKAQHVSAQTVKSKIANAMALTLPIKYTVEDADGAINLLSVTEERLLAAEQQMQALSKLPPVCRAGDKAVWWCMPDFRRLQHGSCLLATRIRQLLQCESQQSAKLHAALPPPPAHKKEATASSNKTTGPPAHPVQQQQVTRSCTLIEAASDGGSGDRQNHSGPGDGAQPLYQHSHRKMQREKRPPLCQQRPTTMWSGESSTTTHDDVLPAPFKVQLMPFRAAQMPVGGGTDRLLRPATFNTTKHRSVKNKSKSGQHRTNCTK